MRLSPVARSGRKAVDVNSASDLSKQIMQFVEQTRLQSDGEDAEALADHYDQVQEWWNDYAEEIGCPVRMHTEEICADLRGGDWNRTLSEAIRLMGTEKRLKKNINSAVGGFLHKEQIRTTLDCIVRHPQMDDRKKGITIAGQMQLGKTGVIAGLFLWEPLVHRLMTDDLYVPHIILPNMKNLEGQGYAELTHAMSIYGSVPIYLASQDGELIAASTANDYYGHEVNIANQKDGSFDLKEVLKRSTSGNIDNFARMHARNRANRVQTIVYIDEAHWGTDMEGTLSKMIGDYLHKKEHRAFTSFRVISATPYEQLQEEFFEKVLMWVGPGYCGPSHFNGEPLPHTDGYKERVPEVLSFSEEFGIEELGFDADAYASPSKFYARRLDATQQKRADSDRSYLDRKFRAYRKSFEKSMRTIIRKILIEGKHQGMMLRIITNNALSEEIVRNVMRGIKEDIEVVDFMGRNSGTPIADLLQQRGCEDKKFIILVSALGRMGCSVPGICSAFVDLTVAFSTQTSQQQGFFGRACGYGKKTTVYVSKANRSAIQKFFDSKAANSGLALSMRAKRVGGTGRGIGHRTSIHIGPADIERLGGHAADAWKAIEDHENEQGHIKQGNALNSHAIYPHINTIIQKLVSLGDKACLTESGNQAYSGLDFLEIHPDLLGKMRLDSDGKDARPLKRIRNLRESVNTKVVKGNRYTTEKKPGAKSAHKYQTGYEQLTYGVVVGRRNHKDKNRPIRSAGTQESASTPVNSVKNLNQNERRARAAEGHGNLVSELHVELFVHREKKNGKVVRTTLCGMALHLRKPARKLFNAEVNGTIEPTEKSAFCDR